MNLDSYGKILSLKFVKNIYIYQPAWKLGKSILLALNKGLKETRIVINIDPALDARKIAKKLQLKYDKFRILLMAYNRREDVFSQRRLSSNVVRRIVSLERVPLSLYP